MAAAKTRTHNRSRAGAYPPPPKKPWQLPRLKRLSGSRDAEGKTYPYFTETTYGFYDMDNMVDVLYMRAPNYMDIS